MPETRKSSPLGLRDIPSRWRAMLRRIQLWRAVSLSEPFHSVIGGAPCSRQELGRLGEDLAARWLRERGRKILYRNYRGPHRGEVDIVCRHGEVLAFTEVKTRTSNAFNRPADAVNPEKQRLIQRGAQEWLRLLGNPKIVFRFDIVEVLLAEGEAPRLNVIENAFQLPASSTLGR